MAEIKNTIYKIEPNGLSGFRGLSNTDLELIPSAEISKTFKPNDNFIELSYFTLDEVRLLTIPNYTNYSVLSGDTRNSQTGNSEISIDVEQDYISYGFQGTEVKVLYNFLDYPYSDSLNPQDFYIESISPDRTELRLISVNLDAETVQQVTNELINKYSNDVYNPDYHLYFRDNIFLSIVNIDVEEYRNTNAVLVKLYNPLPASVRLKTRLNIVEKVADSVAYEINTDITPDKPVIPTLRGANFNVEVEEQVTEPSQYFNYEELFSFPTNNSYRELNSLFNEKGAELGIDYSDFSNFINFSSAEERLRNFKYKLDLIDSYQSNLDIINTTGLTYTATGITGSRVYYENLLDGVINNFDHYERHLYFESGSTSWPKSNTVKPYTNQVSTTSEATTWYTAELEDAILYDAQNPNILTNTIPAYLKEDTSNEPYNIFIHMIGQHFDNLWIYTDAVSQKYNADNRLTRGVSKDLVEELLKNFGVKLYTSTKSVEDLYRYFTVNSYDTGGEYLPTGITASGQQPVSQNDYQKEIYKRIYHNLPLLLKSKGTERGLRALINCFGIPSDILKIKVYGGQSVNDLPFFGGEQALTGSIDKVRLDNTGSLAAGDTLSFYTGITNLDNKYTQDLHRIEVGFSPADNINSYILSQSAVLFPDDPFNIDDYIGDPREINTNVYTSLKTYADQIFENVGYYNLKDFVRLIKFFDNVIFRMVRDFVPARSVTDAGIIIKPHLLERSKYTSPVMSWTRPEYSGSIDTAFISGSNAGAYRSVGYNATGSLYNQESSTSYRQLVKTPSGSKYKSWSTQVYLTPENTAASIPPTIQVTNTIYDREQDQAKFDGQLSGSHIVLSDGELNRNNLLKKLKYKEVKYDVRFYKTVPEGICILSGKGTEENPYILRWPTYPQQMRPSKTFNLSEFFNFAYIPGHTYTRGESMVISNPAEYEFNMFEGEENYTVEDFTCIRDVYDGPGTCQASTYVMKVMCNVAKSDTFPDPFVYIHQPYSLQTFFNITNTYNTDYQIRVNGDLLTQAEWINYNFGGFEDSERVVIKFEDKKDNTCSISGEVTVNRCALRLNPEDNGIEGPVVYPRLYDGYPQSQLATQEWNCKNSILGSTASTTWKVYVKWLASNGQPVYTNLDLIYATDTDRDPHPIPTVPSTKLGFYDRYASVLPDALTTQTSPASRLVSIAITARQSSTCVKATPNFDLTDNIAEGIYIDIPLAYNIDPNNQQICISYTTKSVRVNQAAFPSNITTNAARARYIITNGIPIYSTTSSPPNPQPATGGYYSDRNHNPVENPKIRLFYNDIISGESFWTSTVTECQP